MAERFTNQRCEDCQGGLIYNKEDKYWECPYCGKKYERSLRFDKVQIDGLAGINDLVRSTLVKTISLDFDGAARDLSECEKIDHASIGTLIAHMSLALFRSFYTKDRQQELSKVNMHLQKMNREFANIEDPEEILYDFIDSGDIYALLAVVYSTVNQSARLEMIFELLECEQVYNPNVSKYLLNVLLKHGKVEEADILLKNIPTENCRFGVMTVLNAYPAGEQKAAHIEHLLSASKADTDYSKVFDAYFQKNGDDPQTVLNIFLSAASHNVSFDASVVVGSVLAQCHDAETAERIFGILSKKRLDEKSANAILSWCMYECEDLAVSEIGFKALFDSSSVFEIDDDTMIELLSDGQEDEIKLGKLRQMMSTFKMANKNVDRLIAFHLLENEGEYDFRKTVLEELLQYTPSVQLSVIERYVLAITVDGEKKAEFLDMVLSKSKSTALCNTLFSGYLKARIDEPEIREGVIGKFLDYKLVPDGDAFNYYLLNFAEIHSNEILDRLTNAGCRAIPATFDRYLSAIREPAQYNMKIAYLATRGSFVLSPANFAKFILSISEPQSSKIAHAQQYLEACNGNLRDMRFSANAAGISGNLAQVYLLTSGDDPYVMQEVIKLLQKEKIKLDTPAEGLADRKKVKFHKFIDANAEKLGTKITTLAKELL